MGRREGQVFPGEQLKPDGFGQNDVLIFQMDIDADFTTVGRPTLPNMGATNSPISRYSSRIATLSECPGDFSQTAQWLVKPGGSFGFNVGFTTERARAFDSSGQQTDVGLINSAKKTYYLNIKNTCFLDNLSRDRPPNGDRYDCILDGQFKDWCPGI